VPKEIKLPEEGIKVCEMRHLKQDEVKSVAPTEVNLCKADLWGRAAMIMKAQNPFRNTVQVRG